MGQSDFTSFLDSLAQRDAAKTAAGATFSTFEPDQMADGVRIGAELGIPPTVAASDLTTFRRQADQQTATRALIDAPMTAKWLRDTVNGSLAKDDLQTLTWFERKLGSFGRAAGRGARQVGASVPYARAQFSGQVAQDIGRSLDDLFQDELARIGGDPENPTVRSMARRGAQSRFTFIQGLSDEDRAGYIRDGAAELARAGQIVTFAQSIPMSLSASGFRDETLQNAENTVMGTLRAFVDDPVRGAAFLAETAAETLPMLAAGAAVTAATRNPAAGAAVAGGGSFLRENASSAIGFLQDKGVDLSTPQAAAAVLADADLMREAQEFGVARGVIIAIFDAVSGGVAGQTLMRSPSGDLVAQSIAQAALGSGGEASAQLATTGEIDAREVVIEGLAEVATAPIEVLGVGGRRLGQRAVDAARAGQTEKALTEIDQMAAASKLRERAPDQFRQGLEAQGYDQQSLYVPAQAVREYFQADGRDLSDLAGWGIDPVQMDEALLSGGDVSVPLSSYAADLAGTPDADWLKLNATLDPDEMSVAAAAAFNEVVADIAQAEIEKAMAADEAEQQSRAADQQVFDQVYYQLREAGRAPDAAEKEARVWSAFMRTMGERSGMGDALDVAGFLPVSIRGPQGEMDPVQRRKIDARLDLLRSRGNAVLQPDGPSVAEYVMASGGIRDVGGDVEALELPKGVVAETAAQYIERTSQGSLGGMPSQGRGLELDQMAEQLRGEGFFADVPEDADFAAVLLEALAEESRGNEQRLGQVDPDLVSLAEALDAAEIELGAMSNDEVLAALERGEGREYEQNGQNKRGSILLPQNGAPSGETIINLFESADLSTFLHESGHYFLEAFDALAKDGPEDMQADMAAIRKFLGNEGETFTTEQHEMWARGFEAYVMEGKAPSLELADAFARFKAWLTRIYRSIAGLDVNLTPEIREVMDRMLATDREIAEARAAQEMTPLYTSKPPGMSEADWSTYQRMARRSAEQAEQRLLERTMAKVRREREAWFKAERKAARDDVARQVIARPEHRLIEMLANSRWIGNDEAEIPDIRIDKRMLEDQFGPTATREIGRDKIGGKRAIYGPDGQTPQEVAQFFGFYSATEMMDALRRTGKLNDTIEAETDALMDERHGDPLNDGTIEEEALRAIHSDQQAKTSVAEARHMATRLGRSTKGMQAKVYRQRARRMLENMAVRDAIKPKRFLSAERRAARQAQEAFAKVARGNDGALADALMAKEQQILNGYLYDEAVDLEAMVAKKREKMRSYEKASVRKKLEGGYIEQIDAILEHFDFRVRSPGQIARTESLRGFIDRMIEEGREGELAIDPRLIDDANRRHYTRLTVDELQGVFDTIDNLDHLGRRKQMLIDRARKREFDKSVEGVAEAIRNNLGTGKQGTDSSLRNFFNAALTMDTMLVRMDGGEEVGTTYDEIKRSIDDGQAEEQRLSAAMAERMGEIFKAYSSKELAQMTRPIAVPGTGREWTKVQILAIALNSGNNDNLARLFDETVRPQDRLDRDQHEAILDMLDKRDWDFVQSMWDEINSYWPMLAEVEQRRTGVKPKKVEAAPVETKFGTYTGGYYPIAYDPSISAPAMTDEASAMDKFQATGRGARAAVKNGMTKTRQNNSNGRALRLDLQVPFRHLRDTIRLIALSEAVDNSYRLLNDQRVKQAMLDAGRAGEHQAMNLWLKDLAAGPIFNRDPWNSMARIVKNNFTLSRLAFNFKTVALQVTGIGQSAATIGKRNMIDGMLEYAKDPRGRAEEAVQLSPFMAERQSSFQKDIYDFLNEVEVQSPVQSRARKVKSVVAQAGFAPIVTTQFYGVDVPTWWGAYGAKLKEAGDQAAAVNYADRMVARAQASGLMGDRSGIERGTLSETTRQSDFVKLYTTLGSYMIAKMNRGYVTAMQAKAGMKGADAAQKTAIALNAAADLALLYVFEGALLGLVYSLMDDDEEPEEVARYVGLEVVSAMTGGMPVVRDVASAFQGYGGGGIYGSITELPYRAVQQIEQGENDRALRRALADVGGLFTGMPTTASSRIIEGFLDEKTPPAEMLFGSNPLNR